MPKRIGDPPELVAKVGGAKQTSKLLCKHGLQIISEQERRFKYIGIYFYFLTQEREIETIQNELNELLGNKQTTTQPSYNF